MGKREQLLEIMEDAAKGETKATLRARIAALEAQLAEAKEALTAIDGLAVMEINPSNYDHDDVCELNRNASHAPVIARDALSALEATPPAPKVTEAQAEVVAKLITKWLGRSWEGLPEGRVTEKGFPVFSHSQRGWGFNGRKGDMIDLAREALTAAQEAGKP